MNTVKERKSNYSLFLLSLLLIEFVSYFFRANSLPNLGVWARAIIFTFIIANFLVVLLIQIANSYKHAKIISTALLFWVYSLAVYFAKNAPDFFEIVNLTSWVAVLYLFYHYGFPKSIKATTFLVGMFSLVMSVLYYRYALNGGYVGDKPGVVNAVYYLVLSLPFITLINNRVLRNGLLILVALIVVMSRKGTATIVLFISLIINYLFVKKNKSQKSVLIAMGSCLGFVIAWSLISSFSDIPIFSLLRDDVSSGGNGRFEIWGDILREFGNGGFINQLFGYGMNFSVEVTQNSAHCDFIEILSAFGIFGLLLFVRWFYLFLKTIITTNKEETYFSSICFMVLAQVTIIMMFSTAIFLSSYFLLLMALLGMVLNKMKITR